MSKCPDADTRNRMRDLHPGKKFVDDPDWTTERALALLAFADAAEKALRGIAEFGGDFSPVSDVAKTVIAEHFPPPPDGGVGGEAAKDAKAVALEFMRRWFPYSASDRPQMFDALTTLVDQARREGAEQREREEEENPGSVSNALARALGRMEDFLKTQGKTAPMDDSVEFVRALLDRRFREGQEAMRARLTTALEDHFRDGPQREACWVAARALRELPLNVTPVGPSSSQETTRAPSTNG
jgi:hypothetical protein